MIIFSDIANILVKQFELIFKAHL